MRNDSSIVYHCNGCTRRSLGKNASVRSSETIFGSSFCACSHQSRLSVTYLTAYFSLHSFFQYFCWLYNDGFLLSIILVKIYCILVKMYCIWLITTIISKGGFITEHYHFFSPFVHRVLGFIVRHQCPHNIEKNICFSTIYSKINHILFLNIYS